MADTPAQNLPYFGDPIGADGIIAIDGYGSTPVVKVTTFDKIFQTINALPNLSGSSVNPNSDILAARSSSGGYGYSIYLKNVGTFTISLHSIFANTLSASTTYYAGFGFSTVANTFAVPILRSCKIFGATVFFIVDTTLASAQTFSLYLRVNNTTDNLLFTGCQMNQSVNRYTTSGLNINISAGDTVEFKFTAPAWTTAPVTVRLLSMLWAY
jgi:hypothetical protein